VLLFLVAEAVLDTTSGSVLPTYAASATLLLFIATWLTISVLETEDPLQSDITVVTAGSQTLVRASKLLGAFAIVVGLGAAGMIGPPLASSLGVPGSYIAAGAVAHLVTGLTGVALGALCSRPIIQRTGWALFTALIVDFADIVIPYGVPTRQVLVLFNETPPAHLGLTMLAIAAETVVLALVFFVASVCLTRLRS
jgi:hypothetical protein